MHKGITPVISIILLVLMTVGSAILAFFWITGVQGSIQENVGSTLESSSISDCSRLNIISLRGDGVVVQNTGCSTVNSAKVLINGVLTDYDLSAPLAPGEVGVISYSSQQAGEDLTVIVALGNGQTSSSTSRAEDNLVIAGYSSGSSSCSEASCASHFTMFSDVIESTNFDNCPCCGDDGFSDIFYSAASYCSYGGVTSSMDSVYIHDWLGDRADYTSGKGVCELSGKNWLSHTSSAGATTLIGTVTMWVVGIREVHAADFDNDGFIDFVTSDDNGDVVAWLNDGDSSFTKTVLTAATEDVMALGVGDIDGDNDIDIIAGNYAGWPDPSQVFKYVNDGAGSFTKSLIDDSLYANGGLALLDFDNDGDLDIVTANFDNGGSFAESYTWTNDGTGTFTKTLMGGVEIISVSVGDLDGDGDIDLVCGEEQGSSVEVWLNDGAGVFGDGGGYNWVDSAGDDHIKVVTGDIDNDGDLDFVSASYGLGTPSIKTWTNDGTGLSYSVTTVESSVYAKSVSLADIDNDGDLDIIAGITNSIRKYLNNGSGTFGAGEDMAVDETGTIIYLADIDNDGDLDYITGYGSTFNFNKNTGISSGTGGPCCEVGDTFTNGVNTCTNGVFS